MGRQLFLHHYLPAHLASCLVTGALVEFIFNVEPVLDDIPSDIINSTSSAINEKRALQQQQDSPPYSGQSQSQSLSSPQSQAKPKPKKHFQSSHERLQGQSMLPTWIAVTVILAVVMYGCFFFAPLTYGFPGLSVEQVNRRKWVGYDLHFAK